MDAVDDIGIYHPSITVCFLAIIFTFGLAFSKYGKIKLGEGKPQYTTMSWILCSSCQVSGLLHCTGAFGLGLLLSNSGFELTA